MIEFNEMVTLREKVKYLANGVDPLSGIPFPNDTILISNDNKKIFKQIIEILDRVLRVDGKIEKIDKRSKCSFYITDDQLSKVKLSETPIPISTFTYSINEVIDKSMMKKIQATQITNWLMKNGYLQEFEHDDGKIFKVLTEKSKEIGMSSESKENAYGRKYEVNLYNLKSQKFILNNINTIANVSSVI